MASLYCNHEELNISASDMILLYTELIQNLNICINLYEDLETGRTWGESMSDWAAGDRANINGIRVVMRLKKWKEEMQRGLDLFARLIALIQVCELMHLSINQIGRLQQHYDQILEVVVMLRNTGVLDREKYQLSSPNVLDVGIVTGGVLGIGLLAYEIAKMKGIERGLNYQLVKQLSDAVDNIEFISNFDTFHTTLEAAINSIEIVLKYYKDLGPDPLGANSQPFLFFQTPPYRPTVSVTSNSSTTPPSAFFLGSQPPMQSEPRTEAPIPIDIMEKSIKATMLYAKQREDTKQMLGINYPGMSEEIREEMAKAAAVAACTVYLMEACQLSEADTNRILDTIQSEI